MSLYIPDTKIVQEADEIITAAIPERILNHSKRTYFFAVEFAKKKHINCDMEGLYIAAMFHDLGMADQQDLSYIPFQMRSSIKMEAFLRAKGIEESRINALSEAVDYHFMFYPQWDSGNDAGLLQIGAWMDLTYRKRWTIWKEAREIVKQYPNKGIHFLFPFYLMNTWNSLGCCFGVSNPKKYLEQKEEAKKLFLSESDYIELDGYKESNKITSGGNCSCGCVHE